MGLIKFIKEIFQDSGMEETWESDLIEHKDPEDGRIIDCNGDGIDDRFADSDGDGIPDIYDNYDNSYDYPDDPDY